MDFVNWNSLSEDDKKAYEQLIVIIKDKTVKIEAVNVRRLKPSEVVDKVNSGLNGKAITRNLHVILYKLFNIRPTKRADDPSNTQTEFCLYDETHKDYVYQEEWVSFLIHFLQSTPFEAEELRKKDRNGEKLNIDDYRM